MGHLNLTLFLYNLEKEGLDQWLKQQEVQGAGGEGPPEGSWKGEHPPGVTGPSRLYLKEVSNLLEEVFFLGNET